MPPGLRSAALLAALIACLATALPAAAAQRPPKLVAQIAQAAPTSTPGAEPQLSDEPPTQLGGGGKSSGGGGKSSSGGRQTSASSQTSLAETGSNAGMLALAGFALLGWGF